MPLRQGTIPMVMLIRRPRSHVPPGTESETRAVIVAATNYLCVPTSAYCLDADEPPPSSRRSFSFAAIFFHDLVTRLTCPIRAVAETQSLCHRQVGCGRKRAKFGSVAQQLLKPCWYITGFAVGRDVRGVSPGRLSLRDPIASRCFTAQRQLP